VWNRGDLSRAEEYNRAALKIFQRLAPDSVDVASSLNNVGNVARDRGDLRNAEECQRAALKIQEKLAPGSLDVAGTLNNLGLVVWNRGDLAKAEEYHHGALTIRKKLAPGSLDEAFSLLNLGLVARDRGDLSKAEENFSEGLKIARKLAPTSLTVAHALGNLGLVARDRGDLRKAEECHREATRILGQLAPESLDLAKSLGTLGNVANRRGDLDKAEEYYLAAMRILEKLAPGSLDVSDSLLSLGDVYFTRGNYDHADEYYRAALALCEKLAPGSTEHANVLALLGRTMQHRHNLEAAAGFFARSLDALEHQTSHLGGSESLRTRFRSQHAGYYRGFIDVLLAKGQPERAFEILERSRARSLLEMLAERDLVFATDLPADIRSARQHNAADYDRTQARLASLSPQRDALTIEKLQQRLQTLEHEREEITERVRRASPRLATLQYPQPLDLEATRKALDPGTALLSYLVGEDHTLLFAVLPAGLEPAISVFTLPISEQRIRAEVTGLRALVKSVGNDAAVTVRLKQLYRLLIRPAESVIGSSKRLLIMPDGPLQILPFAALRRGSGQYLVEWKPLHTAVSATVYTELKQRRTHKADKQVALAAFGDPLYPTNEKAQDLRVPDSEVHLATQRGLTLSRLMFSGAEVESIAGLFAPRSHRYLRSEATEEHAKALGQDVQYVHFATHGILDDRFPLNSGLALTIPPRLEEGQENGLLQAWEVFEQLRIDADLATLSGCNTALGQELAGEGILEVV
jgi:CHAT domain-containing protein/Tfp pilus assembly protein PilF